MFLAKSQWAFLGISLESPYSFWRDTYVTYINHTMPIQSIYTYILFPYWIYLYPQLLPFFLPSVLLNYACLKLCALPG